MLIVVSPAKKMNMDEEATALTRPTQPGFVEQSSVLVEKLKDYSKQDLKKLMGVSDTIAELNQQRYQQWTPTFNKENAKPAILAFKGDVYQGLAVDRFDKDDFDYAQSHMRILSGLYGSLRPKDYIHAYRLEMGLPFETGEGNLYAYWRKQVTDELNGLLRKNKENYLVNLASNEYFKVIDLDTLEAEVITPVFKDFSKGQYKVISFLAKKARGMMSAYILQNRISKIEDLKKFDMGGYRFSKSLSDNGSLVFTRKP